MTAPESTPPVDAEHDSGRGGRAPVVAAVVCTHGRPELLAHSLATLTAGSGDDVELIVAESGDLSQNASPPDRATGGPAGVVRLHSSRAGKSYKLNRVVEAAPADILVFTDDDCEVEPGWIEAMARPLVEHAAVGVAFGPVQGLSTVGHAPLPVVAPGEAPLETWLFAHGAAMTVRVAAVRDAGGFDERLGPGVGVGGGEDHDLVLRLREQGWSAWIADAPPVRHMEWRDPVEHRRNLLTYEHGTGVVLGAALRRRAPDSLRLVVRRARYQRSLFGTDNAEGRTFAPLALAAFVGGIGRGLLRPPCRWLDAENG